MAFCTKCGSALADGAKFCGECGAPVPIPVPGQGRVPRAEVEASVPTPVPDQGRVPRTGDEAPRPNAGGSAVRLDGHRKPSSVGKTAPLRVAGALASSVDAPSMPGELVIGTWAAPTDAVLSHAAASAASAARKKAAQPAKRKKGCALPAILGMLATAAAVAALVFYVVPLFISHPHDPHEDTTYVPPAEQVEAQPTQGSEPETLPSSGDEGTEEVVEPTPEPEPEPTAQPAPEPQPTTYATTDTPVIGEFTWFSNDMMNGSAPQGIARITDVIVVTGGWKAYIYNYAIAGNEYSQPSEELLNVYVNAGQDGTTLTFDWYYTRDGDGQAYKNTQTNTEYNGTWANGAIEAFGVGSVRLTDFWEQDGHQYAIGRIGWPDGVDATIALVRP